MNNALKRIVVAGCLYFAMGSSVLLAQQTSASRDAAQQSTTDVNTIPEIVVTANKREENIDKVGLTITAISREELAEKRITSLQDVASEIPSLSYAPSANNTPIFTLRGVGYNNSSLGVYPAVSVYLDQAPLNFPVLASHSAYDLERIEVLKGPQGTLFGQNSTGGAINFIAAKPSNTFEAGGSVSYGRFNEVATEDYVSGPITSTLRARAAVSAMNSDGWQVSESRPYDSNGKQSYVAGRLLIDWDANDTAHFALNANGWNDTSQPQAPQFIVLFPQTAANVQPQELTAPFTAGSPRLADWPEGYNRPRGGRNFFQVALRADFNLPADLTLTSLTSYDHFTEKQAVGESGSSLVVTDIGDNNGYIHSFNQELRLANSAMSSFRWVAGGNLEKSTTYEEQNQQFQDDSANSASLFFINSSGIFVQQKMTNYAFFGNSEFDIGPKLTLKAGARYTNTSNDGSICSYATGDLRENALYNFLGTVLGTVPFTPLDGALPPDQRCNALNSHNVPVLTPTNLTLDEHNISWRGGVDYRMTDNTLLYLNVSRGYKAGTYPVLGAATTSQYKPVTQESVTAYEGGIKAGFWDRKLQMNAAAFYYDYKDKQVLGRELDPVFGVLDVLVNVPKSRVLGAEGDVTLKPFQGMTLNGAITYVDSLIQDYVGTNIIGQPENFAGNPLPFAPKWSYRLDAEYRMVVATGGSPFIGLGANGQTLSDTAIGGGTLTVPDTLNVRVLPGLEHPYTTNTYTTVDARLGYESSDHRWTVMLWGKNIFNKYYWTNVVTTSDFSARFAGLPAWYGVTFSMKVK
jgi:outer membrane receptor protein involved in Fe transport